MIHRLPLQILLTISLAAVPSFHGQQVSGQETAIVIQLGADGIPDVHTIDWPPTTDTLKSRGLLVWLDGNYERWITLPASELPQTGAADAALRQFAGAASRGSDGAPAAVMASATLQLDQLMAQLVVRGAGFITPVAGAADLDGRVTLRRKPAEKSPQRYLADTFELSANNKTLLTLKMSEGTEALPWSSIPDLPEEYRNGLPEGEYSVRAVSGGESSSFRVESRDVYEWVMAPILRLKDLTAETEPLYVQVMVEHLLDQRDENGKTSPYLSDALDLIETLPVEHRTAYLQSLAEQLKSRMSGTQQQLATPVQEQSGIDVIDRARTLLQDGHWSDALKVLTDLEPGKDKRVAGLQALYRAVILAEYGPATGDVSESLFQESLQVLEHEAPADRLRAHNNYANFLLSRAQDRVYNHAFQIATGTADPLSMALIDWRKSRDHYAAALKLAEEHDTAAVVDIRVNQARLYVLLADLVRTLNSTVGTEVAFTQAENSAADQAINLANDVLQSGKDLTPRVRGIVHELLAHLAYRSERSDECHRHAKLAMADYLNSGTLSGVESIHRLLGLIALRFSKPASPQDSTQIDAAALQHFLVSSFLAEFLRDRVPEDRLGLSMAGYFARRAYVNEQIIGLLVRTSRFAEALEFAEAGKARSLQQVLRQHAKLADQKEDLRTVPDILENWPKETTALEYLLGSERGWVFVIRNGDVTAFELTNAEGSALASRELVTRVQQLLSNMNLAAQKMFQRRRFDHDWQTELHALYQILIPQDVRRSLTDTETLLIVPHHVLHYFPFAALVTKTDEKQRSSLEMPQATFLIDELVSANGTRELPPTQGAIVYAPSLTTWDLLRRDNRPPMTEANAVGIVDFQSAARLPGVEVDLANLKKAFGNSIQKLVQGADASEPAITELLSKPGMLFVATHGMNVADQPLSSFLLCHGDKTHDGRLTAGEIFLSPLATDMVVMSACYSGLADRSPLPGDDLFGLQRAFLHSGVQTVVAGLWDVYDATGPMLMNDFFTHFAAGEPVAAALAEAQRDFLKAQRAEGPGNPWTHPYFWAVYTAAGNPQLKFSTNEKGRSIMKRYVHSLLVLLTLCSTVVSSTQVVADDRDIVGHPIEDQLGGDSRIIPSPVQLDDAAFDIYVNPLHIGQAWYSSNAALMADVALQLAEGERVLFRSRNGISAQQAFDVAVRIATERSDSAALERIAKYAANNGHKELATSAGAAQKLASSSRNVEEQGFLVNPFDINPQEFGLLHDCIGQIRMAKIAGDVRSLDLIEKEFLPHVPESCQAGLSKCLGTARHSIEDLKPLPPELSENLKRLALISRNNALDGGGGGDDELDRGSEPVPVTGTY